VNWETTGRRRRIWTPIVAVVAFVAIWGTVIWMALRVEPW
jgi:hypothetical protein